jgi:hypothetical protein
LGLRDVRSGASGFDFGLLRQRRGDDRLKGQFASGGCR